MNATISRGTQSGSSLDPLGSAMTYATKTEIARCAALTAANFIEKGHWVEAYIELHQAARICWERREEEHQQPNSAIQHNPKGKD